MVRGEPDRLFNVEYSDDLVTWKSGAQNIPVINGIGTWGQPSASSTRFVRVESGEVVSEIFSDPSGGNGATTFGGLASVNPTGQHFAISVNFLADIPPSTVELYIDGEFAGYCRAEESSNRSPLIASGTSGTYLFSIGPERLSAGAHTAYARIDASSGTTPGPDNPTEAVTNLARTPEISFNIPGTHLTGCRASEEHILSGEPDSPATTIIQVEYPLLTSNGEPMVDIGYTFDIRNEDGINVRQFDGIEPGPGPGKITFEWDGFGDNGVKLPDGPYYVRLHLTVPGELSTSEPILVKKYFPARRDMHC